MPWAVAKPQEMQDSDREAYTFLREIHTRCKFGSFTWDAPSIAANTTVDTALTTTDAAVLKGLRAGMAVTVSPPSTLDTGLVVGAAWVATDDTLTIRLGNLTGSAINPASGTWAFYGSVI